MTETHNKEIEISQDLTTIRNWQYTNYSGKHAYACFGSENQAHFKLEYKKQACFKNHTHFPCKAGICHGIFEYTAHIYI